MERINTSCITLQLQITYIFLLLLISGTASAKWNSEVYEKYKNSDYNLIQKFDRAQSLVESWSGEPDTLHTGTLSGTDQNGTYLSFLG